ncbi:MAG: GFA family protein [Gammaproteobacteria bacterium]|nr:GFA family protein [Gammaproteobacteria bacterium]
MTLMHEGGCRCGAARYRVDISNATTLICHCRDCQQHLGAPFSVFSVVAAAQFTWLSPPAGRIAFGNKAERLFCAQCGTYLKWEGVDSTDEAEFNTMSLDDPNGLPVDVEIFVRSRLPWVKPLPGIPQHAAGRGDQAS